jgi:tetraacyldisaccharide 4'-kinase
MSKLKEKIESYMYGEVPCLLTHTVLLCLSLIYGLITSIRSALYAACVLRSKKISAKVISVGNITAGGSGKTPVTMLLAKALAVKGKKVAILSRGYNRDSVGLGVVSDGDDILLSPKDSGDEPYQMALNLLEYGIPVIVAKNRFDAAELAIRSYKADTLILDDGFQHRALARDLDIVLLDKGRGLGSGYLLPRGPLRESLSALRRADLFLLKGSLDDTPADSQKDSPDGSNKDSNSKLNFNNLKLDKPAFDFTYAPTLLKNINGKGRETVASLKGKKVTIVSGIADPKSFIRTLESLGAIIDNCITYPDHHWYTEKDLEEVRIAALSTNSDMIITTEKDAVRLRCLETGMMKIRALHVEPIIEGKEDFLKLVNEFID